MTWLADLGWAMALLSMVLWYLDRRGYQRRCATLTDGLFKCCGFWFAKFLRRNQQATVWKRAAKKYYKLNRAITEKYNWEGKN